MWAEAATEANPPSLPGLSSVCLADGELARLCEVGRMRTPVGYAADELVLDLGSIRSCDDRLSHLGLLDGGVSPALTLEARSLLATITTSPVVASVEVEIAGRLRFLDLALGDESSVFVERIGEHAVLTAVRTDTVLASLVRILGITTRRTFLGNTFVLPGDLLSTIGRRGRAFGPAAAAALLREAGLDGLLARQVGAVLASGPKSARVAVEGVAAVAWLDGGDDGLWLTEDASDAHALRLSILNTSASELVRRIAGVLFR